jgi:hypothetical protein
VDSSREERIPVLRREVGCQLGDPGQLQPAVREHLEQDGVLPSRPGHGDPVVRHAFGEVQHVRAIEKHRRAGMARVEMAGVDLGDVSHESSLDPVGLTQKIGEPREELVVGE